MTSFTGLYSAVELSSSEKGLLENILQEYAENFEGLKDDLKALISITSEVKAITHQAALLHGERIKKAQKILLSYRDGAFTAWLTAAYGNRQTPYNFLQYYEFYEAMPKTLRSKIELMPRQAIYTLASRDGSSEQKIEIIQNYKGQTKDELLQLIREVFPLALQDKRRQKDAEAAIQALKRALGLLAKPRMKITQTEKENIRQLLHQMQTLVR